MIPFNISDNSVTFYARGRAYHILDDNPSFNEAREALLTSTADVDTLIAYADIGAGLRRVSNGRFEVTNDCVLFKGNPVDNYFTQKLLKLQAEGLPFEPLLNVLESLFNNPSRSARERFPVFAQVNDLPWYSDGRMIAFKVVRQDWKDKYSGTFDNRVGKVVEVERGEVDDNPDNECSHGLHLGAFHYIPHYGLHDSNSRVVLCAFWPHDVVAVPRDYNGSKMRVCRYEVIQEVDKMTIDEFVEKYQNKVSTFDVPASSAVEEETYDDFI